MMTVSPASYGSAWKWLQRVADVWQRWRDGIPDDNQEGVELGTFRAVSCPVFPRIPLGDNALPHSVEHRRMVKDTFPTSRSVNGVPSGDCLEDVSSERSFETAQTNLTENEETRTVSIDPLLIPAIVVSANASSAETFERIDVLLEETLPFRFLVRFANRVLPKSFQFEEGRLDQILMLCRDGVVPCLLLNSLIVPEMVDVRALNVPQGDASVSFEERCQNHILCLNCLASVTQTQLPKLNPEELAHGTAEACVDLLWRIVDLATIGRVNVHRFPELRALQEDDEDIFEFLQLTHEQLLLRWMRFKLSQSEVESPKSVQNVTSDLSDPRAFLQLQRSIDPELDVNVEGLSHEDCALVVFRNCKKLGIVVVHSVDDLLSGDAHLNSIFLSQIFSVHHGLSLPSDNSEDFNTEIEEFDDEGSQEERTFRMWMNSLGCETSCVNLFSADFRSGWMLLEVLESIQHNCIDWKKANKPPFKSIVSRIKSVENCDQVIHIAKEHLNLSLVGIGGDDIAAGKRKPILALVWQLLRLHTLMVLDSALESSSPHRTSAPSPRSGEKKRLSEADVLSWANSMLDFSGSSHRVTSFRDPELGNSLALLDLLKSIEPHAVQDKYITPGVTPTEKEMNAKYVLSVSRKLGATIFIIWENITEVKPKMLLLLLASFMLLDKQIRKQHKAATLHQRGQKSPSAASANTTVEARSVLA